MSLNKKILLFSQTFNSFSGGGITLTNLFKGWPIDSIAVISYPFMLNNASPNLCKNYYQIGREELSWKFPFSLFKQKYTSGRIALGSVKKLSVIKENTNIKNLVSTGILTPFVKWSGLDHCISTIHLSQRLRNWLSDFVPDILYLQISNRESINFAIELINYLKIPTAIHMMDDWPSTISSHGPFKVFWRKKIGKEFRMLLDKVDVHLSISDAMSEEYFKRYGKDFKAFHNPVDLLDYSHMAKLDRSHSEKLKVLYIGRIGTANRMSLSFFAKIVSGDLLKPIEIEFDMYSKDFEAPNLKSLRKYRNVKLLPAVSHDSIFKLFQQYDLLLLPLDFTSTGIRFARLSFPTKASEYMLSGKPILVFAPEETAVSRFFSKNICGLCVTEESAEKIRQALNTLFYNNEYIHTLICNADATARERFSGEKVRSEFQNLLVHASSLINS